MNNNPIKQTVDVKSILHEIRNEIKKKGYSNILPVFDDSFDQQFLFNMMNNISTISNKEYDYDCFKTICEVEPNKHLYGNRLVVFIKKIIRKFIKFYIVPITEDQNAFNHSVVRILLKNCEMKKQINTLFDRVTKLEELLHEKRNS
jgi:hypothetical protein